MKQKIEWNVKIVYPAGHKAIISSSYAQDLLSAWGEVMVKEMSEEQMLDLMSEVQHKLLCFNPHKGVGF